MRKFIPTKIKPLPENAARVFKGVIFDVYHWEQELFDGSRKTFEMLKRPDSVQVIAVKDDNIIVLEQEQPGVGFFYSFPGGRNDLENENELQAAQRELLEETGMTFSKWKLLSAVQPHNNIDWIVYTFLATDFITQENQKLDAGEKIKVTLKTFDEVKELGKDSRARHLGSEIFREVSSIRELTALPDCSIRPQLAN